MDCSLLDKLKPPQVSPMDDATDGKADGDFRYRLATVSALKAAPTNTT